MFRLATLLILVTVLLIVLWSTQRRLIYFPFGIVPSPDEAGLPQLQNVTFATDDGLTLAGWFVPVSRSADSPAYARSSPAQAPARLAGPVTILFLGGNAGNRAMRAPLAARLAARGIATLLVEYRGYGGNPGTPSEEGLSHDARAARRYLASRSDVDPTTVVYFGESLGTGVAVRLATEQQPLALILRSPFTSLTDVGRHHYPFLPVRLLLGDTFPSLERIPLVKSPLLVIAAKHDSIVPTPLSEQLFAAAPASPKQLVIVDDVDHNDFELLAGAHVIEAIVNFIHALIPDHPS